MNALRTFSNQYLEKWTTSKQAKSTRHMEIAYHYLITSLYRVRNESEFIPSKIGR